MIKKNM